MSGSSVQMASSHTRFTRKDLEQFAFAGIWEFAHIAGGRNRLGS